MIARVKGLNETVDVVEEKDVIHNRTLYYNKATRQHYPEDMVEIVDDYATEKVSYIQMPIDWQQVRIQASIEFAAQILANHGGTPASVANNAVDYADALIKKLKGGQDEINN